MFGVSIWQRMAITVAMVEMVVGQYYYYDKSKEVHPKKNEKYEKPQKPAHLRTDLPNLSTPANIITMDNRTFIQDFASGTYYIRRGERVIDSQESERPRTLIPQSYEGPAEFYAFYNARFGRTYYVNYVNGERGSVRGFHVFDDALEPFQPVSMVQKMLEMMRDTPFFN